MRSTYVLVPALLTLLASTTEAQRSNTKGFLGNLHYSRTSLKIEDADRTDQGNGGGIRLGWGFNDKFTVFLGLTASKLIIEDDGGDGDYGLGQGDLGLTFNFANSNRALVPYLEVALSSHAISYETPVGDVAQAGTGFTFGGGVNYFFARSAALQLGLNFTTATFDDLELDGDTQADTDFNASGGRLMIGLNWYPMKR